MYYVVLVLCIVFLGYIVYDVQFGHRDDDHHHRR